MKRKIVMLIMAGMLTVTSLAGCSSFKPEDVVATVEDQEITAEVANFYARYVQAQYETYYSAFLGENMWESEASEGKTYEESVKDSVLQTLEDMVLLEQHMKEYEVSISEAEEQVIKDSAKAFDEVNALEDKEKVSGSETAVKRVLTLIAIQHKMQDAIQSGADTEVSDEEAAQKSLQYVEFSYTVESEEEDEEKEDDKDGDKKEESREMTDKEKKELQKKAEEFAKAAKGEADFEAYAKGKELEVQKTTFDSKSVSPSEDLIKAADKLKEGETTDVVKTDDGCYVARVTSLLDREATDAKKDTIVSERKQELYTDTCKKWRDDAKITVNDEVWGKIGFKDLKVKMKEVKEDPYSNAVQTDDVADAKDAAEGENE